MNAATTEWIYPSEKNPRDKLDVLAQDERGRVFIAWYSEGVKAVPPDGFERKPGWFRMPGVCIPPPVKYAEILP